MIYLDSSALVKLALAEPESAALASCLAERSDQALVSSALHRAEVLRAIWRAEPGALPRAQRIIRRIGRVALSHDLLDNAATLPPGGLGTTGAIHLASALAIQRDLAAFVGYDKHLLDAARGRRAPGRQPVLTASSAGLRGTTPAPPIGTNAALANLFANMAIWQDGYRNGRGARRGRAAAPVAAAGTRHQPG